MRKENMRIKIKTISERLSAKPSKPIRVFSTKCILWSLGFAFGSCLLLGIVLVLYNNAFLSKNVDSDKSSAITRDPDLNTKSNSENGSIVDMVNVNRSKIALNASDSVLLSDLLSTVVRPSSKFNICDKNLTLYEFFVTILLLAFLYI